MDEEYVASVDLSHCDVCGQEIVRGSGYGRASDGVRVWHYPNCPPESV